MNVDGRGAQNSAVLGRHQWGSSCPHCRSHVVFDAWACTHCGAKKTLRRLLPRREAGSVCTDVARRGLNVLLALTAFVAWHAIPGLCAYAMVTSDQPWQKMFGLALEPTFWSRVSGVLASVLMWLAFTAYAKHLTQRWTRSMAEAVWVHGADVRGPVA